jgi:hypothetical protein
MAHVPGWQGTGVAGVRRDEKPAIKATARPLGGQSAGQRRPAPTDEASDDPNGGAGRLAVPWGAHAFAAGS